MTKKTDWQEIAKAANKSLTNLNREFILMREDRDSYQHVVKALEDKIHNMQRIKEPQAANSIQIGGTHYKNDHIQPWDFIYKNHVPYMEGCVIRYMTRWKQKGGLLDLQKAKHYVEKMIEQEKVRQSELSFASAMEVRGTEQKEEAMKIKQANG